MGCRVNTCYFLDFENFLKKKGKKGYYGHAVNRGNKIRMNEGELHSIKTVDLIQQSIVIILAQRAQTAKFLMIIS